MFYFPPNGVQHNNTLVDPLLFLKSPDLKDEHLGWLFNILPLIKTTKTRLKIWYVHHMFLNNVINSSIFALAKYIPGILSLSTSYTNGL